MFEEGFHDRILSHQGQFESLIHYIQDNPRRLWLKMHNKDLFTLRRNLVLAQNLTFSAMGNLFLTDYPDKQTVEVSRSVSQEVLDQLREDALACAERGVVTITAAISEGERQIAKAIREAGYPLVIILYNGFPQLGSDQGHYYKPSGVYFEACARGQLLLLEPTEAAYQLPQVIAHTDQTLQDKCEAKHIVYTPLPHDSQRWRFVAANEMAKLLTQS